MPRVARYTWRLHWPAALLVGSSYGVIGLSAFVFKRSLGAPENMVPALIAIWQATWILTPLAGGWLERAHPQRVWYAIGIAAALPLLLVAFVDVVPDPDGARGAGTGNLWLYVGLLALHYMISVFYIPHRGGLICLAKLWSLCKVRPDSISGFSDSPRRRYQDWGRPQPGALGGTALSLIRPRTDFEEPSTE